MFLQYRDADKAKNIDVNRTSNTVYYDMVAEAVKCESDTIRKACNKISKEKTSA